MIKPAKPQMGGEGKKKSPTKSPKAKPAIKESLPTKRPMEKDSSGEQPAKKVKFGDKPKQLKQTQNKPNTDVKKKPFEKNSKKPFDKNLKKPFDKSAKKPFVKNAGKPFNKDGGKKPVSKGDGKEEKPKWFEMKKKDRKKMRQQQDNKFYQLQLEAKKLWEKLRRSDMRSEERNTVAAELHALIKGKVVNIIEAHDTSRVVECLYTNGSHEIKNSIFDELKDKLLHYIKCKYAKNVVMSFLRHGSQQHKEAIFKAVQTRVSDLFLHREAAFIISSLYDDYCNNKKKAEMAQEFYSKELTYFKSDQATTFKAAYDNCKDKSAKESMLSDFKESLLKLADKGVVKYGLYHLLLQQLFDVLQEPNDRLDMIRQIQHILVEILHTKEGMQVALHCIWHGGSKERKAIAKTFKQYITKIATIDHGYKVLLGLFDTVDDTVMLNQTIISELLKNRNDLLKDKFGVKVFVYAMCGRDPKVITPDTIELLKKGDNNENSRKDPELRRKELRGLVQKALIDSISENIDELLKETEISLAVRDIILASDEELQMQALSAVVDLLKEPLKDGDTEHLVEHRSGNFILKSFLQQDKTNERAMLARLVMEKLDEEAVRSWWKCNRGAFLCVKLVECKDPEVAQWAKKLFSKDKKVIADLKDNKGAEVLLSAL